MIHFPRLKSFALILLIVLVGLTAVPPLTAQEQESGPPGLSVTAVAGYDGYYKANSWFPVHITASNNGPAISGELQITTGSGASSVVYTAPIELPTQSSKQVTLYVFLPTHSNRLTVRLVNSQNRPLLSVQTNALRSLEKAALLYGLFSGDSGRLAFLETVDGGRPSAAVANLTIAQLPDLAAALNPLDILLFQDVDSGQLTPAQREALAEWVSLGGQLIVAGGPGWQQTAAGLGDLLPVTVQSSRSVADLPALAAWAGVPLRDPGPYVTAVATLRRGETLLQEEGLPLLVRHNIGRGAVYFLALDPTLAPLRDWDGNEKLWALVADNAPRLPGWATGFQQNYAAAEAVQIVPGLSLPSIWIVLFFMVGYIILIGPFNYFLLWRIKRRELAWLTIPAIIALVSVGTYLVGTQLMARAVIVNQLSVAFGHLESDTMRVNGLTTIYSPRRTSYDLTMPVEALVRPFTQGYYGGSGIGQGGNVAAMERDNQLTARRTRVDVGGLQNFVAEFHQPRPAFAGQAAIAVDSAGNIALTAHLQNNEQWTLQNGALIYGDTVYPIGDLAAGSIYEGSHIVMGITGFSTSPATSPYGYYPSPTAAILQGNIEHILGSGDYWNNRALFPRYQLLQAISSDYGGGSIDHLPAGVVTLVGWSTDAALQMAVNPGIAQYQTYNSALYFLELPVTQTVLTGSSLRVPRPLLEWRVLDSEGLGGDPPGITTFVMPTGRIDYEFEPTLQPANGQITHLYIQLQPGASVVGSSQPPPTVSLWNWQTEEWEAVPDLIWGETPVYQFTPYIGPGNAVRLRLENSSPFNYEIDEIYPLLEFG